MARKGGLFVLASTFWPRMGATRGRDMARQSLKMSLKIASAGFWTLVEPPQRPREVVDLYGPSLLVAFKACAS